MAGQILQFELKGNISQFDTAMKRAQDQLNKLGQAADQAGAKQERLRDGFREVAQGALSSAGGFGNLASTLIGAGGVAAAALAAGSAVAKLGSAIHTGIQEVQEWEGSLARLSAVFDGNTATMGRMLNLVERLNQSQPFFEDDQLANAAAALRFFQLTETEIQKLLPALVDMSIVMGESLDSAVQRVGLGLAGSTRSLRNWGILVSEGADRQEVFNAVLAKASQFQDAARDKAGKLEGRVAALAKANKDLAASITENLTPALSTLIDWYVKAADAATKFINATSGPGQDSMARRKSIANRIKALAEQPSIGQTVNGVNPTQQALREAAHFALHGGSQAQVTLRLFRKGVANEIRDQVARIFGEETPTAPPPAAAAPPPPQLPRKKAGAKAAASATRSEPKIDPGLSRAASFAQSAESAVLAELDRRSALTQAFEGGIAGRIRDIKKTLAQSALTLGPEAIRKLEDELTVLQAKQRVAAEKALNTEQEKRESMAEREAKLRMDAIDRENEARRKGVEELGRNLLDVASFFGNALAGALEGRKTSVSDATQFLGSAIGGFEGIRTGIGFGQGAQFGGMLGNIGGVLLERLDKKSGGKLGETLNKALTQIGLGPEPAFGAEPAFEAVAQGVTSFADKVKAGASTFEEAIKNGAKALEDYEARLKLAGRAGRLSLLDEQDQLDVRKLRRDIRAGALDPTLGERQIGDIEAKGAFRRQLEAVAGDALTAAGPNVKVTDLTDFNSDGLVDIRDFRGRVESAADELQRGASIEDVAKTSGLDMATLKRIAVAVEDMTLSLDELQEITAGQGADRTPQPVEIVRIRSTGIADLDRSAAMRALRNNPARAALSLQGNIRRGKRGDRNPGG